MTAWRFIKDLRYIINRRSGVFITCQVLCAVFSATACVKVKHKLKEPRHVYRNITADYFDSSACRRITGLASQQKLGLLPGRRTGTDCHHSAYPGSYGPDLAMN